MKESTMKSAFLLFVASFRAVNVLAFSTDGWPRLQQCVAFSNSVIQIERFSQSPEGETFSIPCNSREVNVKNEKKAMAENSRRKLLIHFSAIGSTLATLPSSSEALFTPKDRRQLEVCLVNVLRVVYWSQNIAITLQSADDSSDTKRAKYLEARLGAKAALTGKVGGGASGKVYTLASLRLPSCLEDLEYYARPQSRQVADLRRDFYEGLAAVVEFDGLDTLTDPSPRSSLTLGQVNEQKVLFVQRMLAERVVPIGQQLVASFPAESVQQAHVFMQQYYSSELPLAQKRDDEELATA
jgi:hypothetical protein